MILIVCVDNKNGMMFNKRRQSRDRLLTERIKELAKNTTLWVNSYSAALFENGISIDDDFQSKAEKGDYCFVENVKPLVQNAEKIIIYKWNRDYPSDTYFDADLSDWSLSEVNEFEGYSHELITEEIYTK
jgi:hypothetical protein